MLAKVRDTHACVQQSGACEHLQHARQPRVACEGCAPDSHMYVQPVVCEVAFVQIWVCVVSVAPLCGPGLRQLNLVLDSAFSRPPALG